MSPRLHVRRIQCCSTLICFILYISQGRDKIRYDKKNVIKERNSQYLSMCTFYQNYFRILLPEKTKLYHLRNSAGKGLMSYIHYLLPGGLSFRRFLFYYIHENI
jgi:hypothetical protein